jgi:hypothetical protein
MIWWFEGFVKFIDAGYLSGTQEYARSLPTHLSEH